MGGHTTPLYRVVEVWCARTSVLFPTRPSNPISNHLGFIMSLKLSQVHSADKAECRDYDQRAYMWPLSQCVFRIFRFWRMRSQLSFLRSSALSRPPDSKQNYSPRGQQHPPGAPRRSLEASTQCESAWDQNRFPKGSQMPFEYKGPQLEPQDKIRAQKVPGPDSSPCGAQYIPRS